MVQKVGGVLVALGAAMATVFAIQLGALARAGGGGGGGHGGGGGGHSSGGGFGGGYHGGGGFGGGASAIVFFLVLGVIALLVIWAALQRRNSSSTANDDDDSAVPIDTAAVEAGLKALQARDPNFSPQVFIDRAQQTFFVLQNAWMERNLEPARIYLSDGIYNRWKLQVEQFVAMHKRNVLENLAVNGCLIAKVGGDANFDHITVRFDAIAKDYEVDDSGKMVGGDKTIEPFTEYWTFIRSQAARSRVGETAQITQCPNCGAPVSVNESGICAYCKATVTTGQFGWVLDNITQASEWSAAA
jgi:inner membrane protein import complex subunit Tim44-like protein